MCDWETQSSSVWRHNIGALTQQKEHVGGRTTTLLANFCMNIFLFNVSCYTLPTECKLVLCLFVCLSSCRQFVFAAFTEEFISAPFTEQIFHFFIPALSDVRLSFPFEAFLSSLQATISSSSAPQSQAPWVFYFVLSAGENRLGGWRGSEVCTQASVCTAHSLYIWGSFKA